MCQFLLDFCDILVHLYIYIKIHKCKLKLKQILICYKIVIETLDLSVNWTKNTNYLIILTNYLRIFQY